jgi:nuclear pore complex protein Nup155
MTDMYQLYNNYADQAGYFDVCLQIYQAADHRNPADIEATWLNLLESTHAKIVEQGDQATELPYEAVIQVIRATAYKLNLSETIMPPPLLIPMLLRYSYEHQRGLGAPIWVTDLFIEIGFPYEILLSVLEAMFYNDETPFEGRNRRIIGNNMVHVIKMWYLHCTRNNQRIFGSDENAATILQSLTMLTQNGLTGAELEDAQALKRKIERELR